MESVLKIDNLKVSFKTYAGKVHAVRGVSLEVGKGETLAIVGESGCGKSVTAQSIMRLVPEPPGVFEGGKIWFKGRDLLKETEAGLRRIRGKEIGMIFQDPMTSLNPTMTVGNQIGEVLKKHQKLDAGAAQKRVIELLSLVGIPKARERVDSFPHQFSGGMRQRVVAAIAVALSPSLLIADEPTTALDVTIQAQILEMINDLKTRLDTSIILITHDLGVVASLADRVVVMYAGEVVEEGKVDDIFFNSRHPYTSALLNSVPRLDREEGKLQSIPGTPPDMFDPPVGCAFQARCSKVMRVCQELPPPEFDFNPGHRARCWLHHPLARTGGGVA